MRRGCVKLASATQHIITRSCNDLRKWLDCPISARNECHAHLFSENGRLAFREILAGGSYTLWILNTRGRCSAVNKNRSKGYGKQSACSTLGEGEHADLAEEGSSGGVKFFRQTHNGAICNSWSPRQRLRAIVRA
jgi:hypothetical protein